MNRPEDRIPEEKTQEVFALAAQLYAQHNQSYSVKELMDAGAEAKIPPEFIQQAVEQIQLQRVSTQQPVPAYPQKRPKPYLIGLAIGLPLLAALAVGGTLLSRNAAVKEAPTYTTQPIPDQPQLSDTTQGAGNFKCANLNLEGQDLSARNLKGADCTRAKLAEANLKGTILEGANLSGADLKKANLSRADLKGADLADANLAGADLSGVNLEGANLSNTDLTKANLSNANLTRADLAGANTTGANFKGVKK
jgi:hypothetical protein